MMPVLFIGHGSPMNALADNAFTQNLSAVGAALPKPEAILVISAHWLTKGSFVSAVETPETIYDFYGFPDALYKIVYPAPGSPKYAEKAKTLWTELIINTEWGLDHGAWSVLKHLFPHANIPVFQLSIDYHKPMQYHFDNAQKLAALRNEGVLIIGSGNIVHNLRLVDFDEGAEPYDWALQFDDWAKNQIVEKNYNNLIHYENAGQSAPLAVPTVDHYVPLLYSLAVTESSENISFFYEGIELSSMSMRCIKIG
jgi:4,5-DOPA dioxygenase extradiol